MKKLTFALALIMLLSMLTGLTAGCAEEGATYEQTLFDRSKPIEIDIQMDDETWNNMIANAENEEYAACNLVVNGVMYENVAIRPKGNSSLASVSSRGSERFSWRIKFDKYEKKRTCDGLDILILNNGFQDAGELKEAIAYDMYAFLDADASLYNYAIVYHNGEYFGCYLALEGVDKSFAKRNYGEDYGKLYKPEFDKGGDKAREDGREDGGDDDGFGNSFGGKGGFPAMPDFSGQVPEGSSGASAAPAQGDAQAPAQGDSQNSGDDGDGSSFGGSAGGQMPAAPDGAGQGNMPQGFNFGMPGMGGGGARTETELARALNYVGDDLEAYQSIWDSAKFKTEETDYRRVVEALKHVSERDGIGDYVDVDNVLKYMAIQAFIYNNDGLTDEETHNYYLYEENGKLNLIPWDMNQSFSVSGNGSDYVNFPIDTPFTVSDLSERDFFMALLENEEYLAKYHEYLRQLSEEYVLGGALAATLERIHEEIDTYVETDPTAFSTYEQFSAAASSLQAAAELRAQSVLGQISGEIPSTREGQTAEPDKLLDTGSADLSGLNSMGIGGMNFGNFTMPNMPDMQNFPNIPGNP